MKLQDYLHYYMGATFWTKNSEGEVNPETLRFIYPMIEKNKDVKLELRRLEDMIEEEAEKLAMIYSGAVSVKRTKGVAANWHYYHCYFGQGTEGEVLTISADGSAWYAHYFDKNQPGHRNIVNEHFATDYLLRKHFDLFGLINAGLAIDAKNIKR